MAQVKVWNDNDHDYREMFKGHEIKIRARSSIEMEYYDAHEFKGSFKAIERDADNQPLPQSFKKIRVEEPKTDVDAKIEVNTCAACNYKAVTPKDLLTHILANHADEAVVDEEAEKAIRAKKKAG